MGGLNRKGGGYKLSSSEKGGFIRERGGGAYLRGGLNRGFTVSMLYKIRYLLISHDGAKLQSSGHSYSTRSMVEYSYTQPTYKYSFYP